MRSVCRNGHLVTLEQYGVPNRVRLNQRVTTACSQISIRVNLLQRSVPYPYPILAILCLLLTYPLKRMQVKTVDHYWNANDKAWKHRDSDSDVPAELVQPVGGGASTDDWKEYGFVVVRRMPDPRSRTNDHTIKFKIVVKDSHLLKACREVIGAVPGLSWNSEPVEVSHCASL